MASVEGPDRGRAWLIAFAACIINMILSGISRMIGILYVAVIDEYGVSRQEATIPFSTRNSIRSLAGPLVGVVGQMVGIRTITFFGGVVAALGACLCSIAPNITWLTILWGAVHGSGFAFANTLFQVIVNQYFEKYRATASGLALSGACVGSLAFPFLFEAIIDEYRLSGAFLILGGVVMHVLPMSLFLCSPPWLKEKKSVKKTEENLASVISPSSNTNQPQETADIGNRPSTPQYDKEEDDDEEEEEEFQRRNILRSTSLSDYPEDRLHVLSAEQRNAPEHSSVRSRKSVQCQQDEQQHANGKCPAVKCVSYVIKEEDSPPRERITENEIGFSATTTDNNQSWPSISSNNSGDIRQNRLPDISGSVQADKKNETKRKKEKRSLWKNVLSIVSLYKNPVYVLISVSISTYILIFIPILTVIVDYGKDKGMGAAEGKYLINAMAVGDLFGRLCFGWVTDKKFMAIYKFMALCQVLQGGIVAMFPLTASLFTFMMLLGLYGMTAGMVLVHFPILVLKYVSVDDQAVAMGTAGFLSGIVTFGIPPMIGLFRDQIGSYDGMFYFIGAISLVSGAVWLLEPIMARKLRKNEARRCARTR